MKKLSVTSIIFFISAITFNIEAMVISSRTAYGISLITTATSWGMISLLPNASRYAWAIGGSGVIVGALSYLGIREYTPDQILHRAAQAENEMRKSKIGCFFDMSQKVTLETINGISDYPCIDTMVNANIHEEHLKKHIDWLALAKKHGDSLNYDFNSDEAKKYSNIHNTQRYFENYIKRIHTIRSIINSETNRTNYKNETDRYKENKGLQLEERKMGDKESQTDVKKTNANTRRFDTILKYGKWVLVVVVTSPIWLRIFAWSSMLPYPR